MPDLFYLLRKWGKQMLAVMILSLLAVGFITFLKPRQWLSVATALPASSVSSDKSKIFNENIEALYSALGSPDDLDRVLGTARLDTVYLSVTDQFNLFDHYKMTQKGEDIRIKAALLLKKNTRVMKSEYGELKVKVWDTDKKLAPQLANAVLDKLQVIHTDLQNAANETALKGLQDGQKKIQTRIRAINDSLNKPQQGNETMSELAARKKLLQDQLLQYDKLISEYQLMADSKAPALIIVEPAKPATKPDRPRRMQIMVTTAILSFLFALLAALILERRKIFRL